MIIFSSLSTRAHWPSINYCTTETTTAIWISDTSKIRYGRVNINTPFLGRIPNKQSSSQSEFREFRVRSLNINQQNNKRIIRKDMNINTGDEGA